MSWSVGLISSNKAFMCQMDMERLGIESYIPTGTRLTKPKRKHKAVRTIFFPFPGYIFVKDYFQHRDEFNRIRGFKKVVFNNIPEVRVNDVRDRQSEGAFDIDGTPTKTLSYKRGEQVRITMGPLMGQLGVVEKDTKALPWACLNVLGMKVKIFIDFIEKI
jgi:transcription antitermination factor NusG